MEQKIKDMIEKEIENAGYILDNVLYLKENNTNFLRIIIDKIVVILILMIVLQ